MLPTGPASQRPAMQPLGAAGTPASPQALPYNAFPAPQIGMASAGRPASPIAPMMQNTQAQIGDALSAARGPQPQPQLAVQPPQQGAPTPGSPTGALGMAYQPYQQPPQQLKRPEGHESFMQGQMAPQGGMAPPPSYDDRMPPGMREMLMQGGRYGNPFRGGFDWGQMQQPDNGGRTPYPVGNTMRPGMGFSPYMPSPVRHGGDAGDEAGMAPPPFGGFNWRGGR